VCAISGSVGTFANVDPRVEEHVAHALGLKVEPISTQVIRATATRRSSRAWCRRQLDRALATEIRHLQRTEVLEAEEYFSQGQKARRRCRQAQSRAVGESDRLARMVRGYVAPALEDVVLWHERDISHSSVERFMGRRHHHVDSRSRARADVVENSSSIRSR